MSLLATSIPAMARASIEEFHLAGGVLDYFVLDTSGATADDDLHRQAALRGMELLDVDLRERNPAWALDWSEPTSCSPVTVREFVGSRFDWGTGRLDDPHQSDFLEDPDANAYAHAFSRPPYPIRLSPKHLDLHFATINAELLAGLSPDLDIRRWSPGWSSYFEAGLQWWGAYYWTVHSPANQRIVVIVGSAPD